MKIQTSSSISFLLAVMLVLLQVTYISAQDAGMQPEENPDDASFEELVFETTVLSADAGPDPEGEEAPLSLDPVWWDMMKRQFSEKANLQKCYKRGGTPPVHGSTCSERKKSCLFGTQTCPGGLQLPELHCKCKNGVWICEYQKCPQCPRDPPSEELACPATEGLTCNYDTQQCCGDLYPNTICTCEAGETAECDTLDMCISPSCLINDWSELIGKTCDEATDLILEDYPGMTIECTTDTSLTLKPIMDVDMNLNRVYIITDASDTVIEAPKVG